MPSEQGAHHAQIMKGALDMCLLATIERQPNYGYGMVRLLNEQGLAISNESTIYPVLKRLSTRGLIESYLEPSSAGPARKYYRSTPDGTATLNEWVSDWNFVRDGVDAVLSTGPSGSPNKKKS
jgi:PadR family transcriptional regulator PadR